MMRRLVGFGTLVFTMALLGLQAGAQQGGAPAWPDPPAQTPAAGAAQPGTAAPAKPKRRAAAPKPAAAPAAEPSDAAAGAAAAQPAPPKRRVANPKPAGAVQSVKCEGPFGKDATHAAL